MTCACSDEQINDDMLQLVAWKLVGDWDSIDAWVGHSEDHEARVEQAGRAYVRRLT